MYVKNEHVCSFVDDVRNYSNESAPLASLNRRRQRDDASTRHSFKEHAGRRRTHNTKLMLRKRGYRLFINEIVGHVRYYTRLIDFRVPIIFLDEKE